MSFENQPSQESIDQETIDLALESDILADELEKASPSQIEVLKELAKDPKTYLCAFSMIASAFLTQQSFMNIREYMPSPEQYPEQVNNFRIFSAWALASSGGLSALQYLKAKREAEKH